jgi:hypothetical protein
MICIYGKATGKVEKCSLRLMNKYGMALTPRRQWYYFIFRIKFSYKTPKPEGPFTTFTKSFKGVKLTFG